MFYTFLTWQIGEVSFTFISEGFWFHKIRNMFSSLANFSNASLEINTFFSQKMSAAFRAGWNFFLIINNFDFFFIFIFLWFLSPQPAQVSVCQCSVALLHLKTVKRPKIVLKVSNWWFFWSFVYIKTLLGPGNSEISWENISYSFWQ